VQQRVMSGYSDLVRDHFERPRNAGVLEDADGIGERSNPVCGDRMRVMIRIAEGCIAAVRWQTRGCPAAIATSSFASEMVAGWTVEQVRALTREAIAEAMGGLPRDKVHCSVLVADALKAAIADYERRRG
jgi:nitrogen fixation NifU-like protein